MIKLKDHGSLWNENKMVSAYSTYRYKVNVNFKLK